MVCKTCKHFKKGDLLVLACSKFGNSFKIRHFVCEKDSIFLSIFTVVCSLYTVVEIRKSIKKRCLHLGPIYLESATPEVFKTSVGKIPQTLPSETIPQNSCLEMNLLNKVNFFNNQSKRFKKKILLRGHLHNKFSILA